MRGMPSGAPPGNTALIAFGHRLRLIPNSASEEPFPRISPLPAFPRANTCPSYPFHGAVVPHLHPVHSTGTVVIRYVPKAPFQGHYSHSPMVKAVTYRTLNQFAIAPTFAYTLLLALPSPALDNASTDAVPRFSPITLAPRPRGEGEGEGHSRLSRQHPPSPAKSRLCPVNTRSLVRAGLARANLVRARLGEGMLREGSEAWRRPLGVLSESSSRRSRRVQHFFLCPYAGKITICGRSPIQIPLDDVIEGGWSPPAGSQ